MKLIFLDVDGVLNSDTYFASEAYKKETTGASDAEIMLILHQAHLDPNALQLLNDLVQRSGAEVVLSSTWRSKYSPTELTEMMQKRGATFTISDSTPILYGKMSERIPRGKEIKAYLSKLAVQPETFVILDDHDDMLGLKKFLVWTDYKPGLTSQDVEQALQILNGDVK